MRLARPRNLRGFVLWGNARPPDLPLALLDAPAAKQEAEDGFEQMPLRLMLCAFILLALGGCQNPSRIQAASSHSAAVE